jgi:hypothetical protein
VNSFEETQMKNFDPDEFTVAKLSGITPENFRPIYVPAFCSIALFVIGAVFFLITDDTPVFKIIIGLSGVVFALSGLGQIKLKEVPGFPSLRGGCAVAFGMVYFVFFLILGVGFIFFE